METRVRSSHTVARLYAGLPALILALGLFVTVENRRAGSMTRLEHPSISDVRTSAARRPSATSPLPIRPAAPMEIGDLLIEIRRLADGLWPRQVRGGGRG